MLLASGLPISSGASPFDFLRSFRCAPTSSPTPNTPLQPSPALPCIFGRQTGFEGPAVSAAPHRGQAPPGAERGIAHPFICHLCAPLERLETSAWWRHHPATPGAPAPRGGARGREDREGLQGSGGKGPPPRLPGWLRGSCEDSSTRKRRKAEAAETSQGGLAENLAHQIR